MARSVSNLLSFTHCKKENNIKTVKKDIEDILRAYNYKHLILIGKLNLFEEKQFK